MNKLKIGVFGITRGVAYAIGTKHYKEVELVAICDKLEDQVEKAKLKLNDPKITYYANFDDFINHDMDIVVLANYATEHAPYAIRCLEKGINVISELLPFQNMKEAVALVEAVEKSGKIYSYAENCCYMPAPMEMKRLYEQGKIGEFLYGECEYLHDGKFYVHNYGDPTHWRTWMYSTFYCTHSLGPIIHATGLRPVSVTGFELPVTAKCVRNGKRCGQAGIEMVTLENGAIIKSTHGALPHYSLWWNMQGTKGSMESARYNQQYGDVARIFVNANAEEDMEENEVVTYLVKTNEASKDSGHGGSDFFILDNMIAKIKGEPADMIDIYEACDMFLPGMFAFRSLLNGGVPTEIPNMRKKEDRDKWRNDTSCTDAKVAGDMLWPTHHLGTPDIPPSVWEDLQKKWQEYSKQEIESLK